MVCRCFYDGTRTIFRFTLASLYSLFVCCKLTVQQLFTATNARTARDNEILLVEMQALGDKIDNLVSVNCASVIIVRLYLTRNVVGDPRLHGQMT